MDKEFLQAEVASLLHQAKLSRTEAAAALEAALVSVFAAPARRACCPFCRTIFPFDGPVLDRYLRLLCPQCREPSFVVTGTVVSKRSNHSSPVTVRNGLFLRFKDAAARERYIEVYGHWTNAELKAKDEFSVCVGEKTTSAPHAREGKASMMNLTLNTAPVLATVRELSKVLAGLQASDAQSALDSSPAPATPSDWPEP